MLAPNETADLHARVSAFLNVPTDAFRLETLAGEASTRRYHRVSRDGRTQVIMELPAEERGKYDRERFGFTNVHTYLSGVGFPVPRIDQIDLDAGLLAVEDLGDVTLDRAQESAERLGLYKEAVHLIGRLQSAGQNQPSADCLAFSRCFDFKLLRWELEHFIEWFLEAYLGAALSPAERRDLSGSFDELAAKLAAGTQVLVHRDFQSRNLMVLPEPRATLPGRSRLRVLDFQDALLGPPVYDLVALLRDSYVQLDPSEVAALMDEFMTQIGVTNASAFRSLFYQQTLQRKLKDAGRFVFIDRVRHNPRFLQWIPTTLTYIRDALGRLPEFGVLHYILTRHIPDFG